MIHLHNHDEYSLLDGFGMVDEYVKYAKDEGFKGLAITNHANIDGVLKFQNACEKYGVCGIIGCELYVVKDIRKKVVRGEKKFHITCWVKNQKGWKNLMRILTIANSEGFFYKPRVDRDVLLKHCEGLVFGSACASSIIHKEYGESLFLELSKKTEVFLEVMPHDLSIQKETNQKVLDFAKKYGIDLLATNDCHYSRKEDSKLQEVLLAVQTKKKMTDKDRFKFDIDTLFFMSENKFRESFKRQGILTEKEINVAILNTEKVFNLCKNFKIMQRKVQLPSVPGLGEDEKEELLKLCKKGWQTKGLDDFSLKEKKEYETRLMEELRLIEQLNFVRYFLVVWEVVKWAKDVGIMVGAGRGSAGGSLVCYLLGITTIDPVKYNLLFARFINPARMDLPDIDIDFQDNKRYLIRKHLEELYGKNNIASVSTFSKMKGRSVLKDVARVFGLSFREVNQITNCIEGRIEGTENWNKSIQDAVRGFDEAKDFKEKHPVVVDYAEKMEGQVRSRGVHASALIVAKNDLTQGKQCVIIRDKDKKNCINWDKHDLEYFGLMKLDILGLSSLTMLNHAKKEIKENHGKEIDYYNLGVNDEKIFKAFSSGYTVGCFQLGTLGLRKFCQRLGIENFELLIHVTALYRPGTLASGMAEEFIKRKRKEIDFEFLCPAHEEITKNTYGIIVYQEQVMQIINQIGGLKWEVADKVRKLMAKSKGKEALRKYKEMFVSGAKKQGELTEKQIHALWDTMETFGAYGFNRSHAVAYTHITYWDMWTKLNYPAEFFCSKLSYMGNDFKEEIIDEAVKLGLDVRPPKIDFSHETKWKVKGNVLYAPFSEIKGIGEKTVGEIVKNAKIIKNKTAFVEVKMSKKIKEILDIVDVWEDKKLTDDKAEQIEDWFQFSLLRDKTRKYKRLLKKFSVLKIKNLDFLEKMCNNEENYFFGKIQRLKLKYTEERVFASAEIKDSFNVSKITFCEEIIERKKGEIEKCEDSYAIIWGKKKKNQISVQELFFVEDMESLNLKGLNLKLIHEEETGKVKIRCSKCKGSLPFMMKKGRKNVMVIYETPQNNRDKYYSEFWNLMRMKGLQKNDYNETSFCKCMLAKGEKLTKTKVNKCKPFLEKEIEAVKPAIIFAFGNQAIGFFEGEAKGILTKNSQTIWSDKYSCWVHYCLSPFMMKYDRQNITEIENSVSKFSENMRILS